MHCLNQVKILIDAFDQKTLQKIFNKESVEIELEGQKITLDEEDVLVEREVLTGVVAACVGKVTIALYTEITPELKKEGIAREIINKINTLRKQEGFEITDRIDLQIEAPIEVEEAYLAFQDYITGEILAKKVLFCPVLNGKEIEINENQLKLIIAKS